MEKRFKRKMCYMSGIKTTYPVHEYPMCELIDTPNLICFAGDMGSGKDTIAHMFCNSMFEGRTIIYTSFAQALRNEIVEIIAFYTRNPYLTAEQYADEFGCSVDDEDMLETILDELYKSVDYEITLINVYEHTPVMRKLLQFWGSDVRRKQDKNYWVKKMRKHINSLRHSNPYAVICITDGRFPNELNLINNLKGITVKVDIDEDIHLARLASRGDKVDSSQLHHVSENALHNYTHYTFHINNSGRLFDTCDELAYKYIDVVYSPELERYVLTDTDDE